MQQDYQYWDLGDVDFIRMSDKSLANVLRGLVKCRGRLHGASEINGHYSTPNRNTVSFRISLPKDRGREFELLTGLTLSQPPQVQLGILGTPEEEVEQETLKFPELPVLTESEGLRVSTDVLPTGFEVY